MAWTFTFYRGYDRETHLCYGECVPGNVSQAPTASSAAVAVPEGATIVAIKADSSGYVSNNGQAASPTNGTPLGSGDKIDIGVNTKNGLFLY